MVTIAEIETQKARADVVQAEAIVDAEVAKNGGKPLEREPAAAKSGAAAKAGAGAGAGGGAKGGAIGADLILVTDVLPAAAQDLSLKRVMLSSGGIGYFEHEAEIVERHLREALVAQNAGIVHEYVDAPPMMEHLRNHRSHGGFVGNRRRNRHRLATCCDDFRNDAVGGRLREVIDHQAGTLPRQIERMGAP